MRYNDDRNETNNHYVNIQRSNDFGPEPYTVNIEQAALQNNFFRNVLWTGKHMQVVLMSLNPGEDIGLEVHPETDQFFRIERGQGLVMMGKGADKNKLDFRRRVSDGDAIMVPAGTWHNLINAGRTPLKLYTIYAPPKHPFGTVQMTKKEAEQH